jgi:hypothetical protein
VTDKEWERLADIMRKIDDGTSRISRQELVEVVLGIGRFPVQAPIADGSLIGKLPEQLVQRNEALSVSAIDWGVILRTLEERLAAGEDGSR